MIKVLGFALYGQLAASTRYRLGQYVPGLARMGIDLEICYLLDDNYLRTLFEGNGRSKRSIIRGLSGRISDLVRLKGYDLAVIYCELFPLIPAWLERTLMGRPYIYDFDDAFYLKYRSLPIATLQSILNAKFEGIIRNASAVTAGNRILAGYAERFNPQTLLLPTVVDTTRYIPALKPTRSGWFTIGWIGSPSTARYLSDLVWPLSVLGRESPVRLIVIGGKAPVISNVNVLEIPWNETNEVELLNQFDVGVMPLPNDDWAKGKCAFKLIQYMACGIPVIASPVGANLDVVTPDCGYLANTPKEWLNSFRILRDDLTGRRTMGDLGRLRVVDNYSLNRNLPLLAQAVRHVVNK